MKPIIEIRHVDIVFPGGIAVLRDVSLDIRAGDCVAVLGKNGSGKTTLLRAIYGNILPTSGHVRVAGLGTQKNRGRIADLIGVSLYPERSFYYRLSVDQNLRYFQSLRARCGRTATAERAALLEQVGLESKADTRFMELSLGQRKRLGLARAMITEPAVIILDEPFANLDDEGTAVVVDLVQRRRTDGLTTVFTTHEMADVHSAVNVVATLGAGRVTLGTTADGNGDPERKPTRTLTVIGSRKLNCDLTPVSSRFPTTVDGKRIEIDIPVDLPLSSAVEMFEAAGVAVEQAFDTPWLR
ncbi:ABC transporter ATP-binding protein [Nocardia sp. NPDC019395]|uniref:ABC transporter ATP-binding protein n=1 Tax=Nocardia sp. NPDC019395 TaxID=3154686 RepID=UPI003402A2C1